MMIGAVAGLGAVLVLAAPCHARVVRVSVEVRESPSYAPAYQRLVGRFFGELDPGGPMNAIINDIALAPRNSTGRVEYSATFTLLRPKDARKTSGVLWYEVPNRGNSPLNPRPAADAL